MKNTFFKLRYDIKGKEPSARNFCILNVEESDLRELEVFGSDRSIFAELIKILDQAEVSAIIFDIIFEEYKNNRVDEKLVQYTEKADMVFYPLSLGDSSFVMSSSRKKSIAEKQFWTPAIEAVGDPVKVDIFTPPFYNLAMEAKGLGAIALTPDNDGISSRLPLVFLYEGRYIPSLVLAGICEILKVKKENIEIAFGRYIKLIDASPFGEKKDYWIPIDNRGRIHINYAGPWADSLEMYSLRDVFSLAKNNPGAIKELFRNTIIMIADITYAKNDFARGVFENKYPKNGIISNAINTILTENYLTEPGSIELILISVLLVGIVFIIAFKSKVRLFIVLIILLSFFYILLNGILFVFFNRLPSIFLHMSGIQLAFIGLLFYKLSASAGNKTSIVESAVSKKTEICEVVSVPINEKACREFNVTPRQKEILFLLQKGFTYKRIAESLGVQEGTIKRQITRIKDKTNTYYKNEFLELFFPL